MKRRMDFSKHHFGYEVMTVLFIIFFLISISSLRKNKQMTEDLIVTLKEKVTDVIQEKGFAVRTGDILIKYVNGKYYLLNGEEMSLNSERIAVISDVMELQLNEQKKAELLTRLILDSKSNINHRVFFFLSSDYKNGTMKIEKDFWEFYGNIKKILGKENLFILITENI